MVCFTLSRHNFKPHLPAESATRRRLQYYAESAESLINAHAPPDVELVCFLLLRSIHPAHLCQVKVLSLYLLFCIPSPSFYAALHARQYGCLWLRPLYGRTVRVRPTVFILLPRTWTGAAPYVRGGRALGSYCVSCPVLYKVR